MSALLIEIELPEASTVICEAVLVSWYMVITGTTSRQKMTKVMRILTSLSMRELL